MAEDLQELLDRIKWAREEIRRVEEELNDYGLNGFRLFSEPSLIKPGTGFLAVEVLKPMPVSARARSGTIANELRSCLDGLASTLAERNGRSASGAYFPVADKEEDLTTVKHLRDKVQKFSPEDRETIYAFRPFAVGKDGKPGNLLLYGLHHADIKRKHHRLAAVSTGSSLAFVQGYIGHMRTIGGPVEGPRTYIAEVSRGTKALFKFIPRFVYAEPDVLSEWSVVEALDKFADVTEEVVSAFAK